MIVHNRFVSFTKHVVRFVSFKKSFDLNILFVLFRLCISSGACADFEEDLAKSSRDS